MIEALISLEGNNLQPENDLLSCELVKQSLVKKTSQIEIKYRTTVKTKSMKNLEYGNR